MSKKATLLAALLLLFVNLSNALSCHFCSGESLPSACDEIRECPQSSTTCTTIVLDRKITKRCASQEECQDGLRFDKSVRKSGDHRLKLLHTKGLYQCCSDDLCNNVTKWDTEVDDELTENISESISTFTPILMVFQLFTLAAYCSTVAFIFMQSPKETNEATADDLEQEDDDDEDEDSDEDSDNMEMSDEELDKLIKDSRVSGMYSQSNV